MVVGQPTADTIVLRRPDGRLVEIVVVAAHRGGTALRSRWLCGATLEEVAFFGAESTGAVVNAEELLRAAEARLLPGTQVRIVSSPMGRQGLLYDLYKTHFGKPGRVLVVHAPTLAMNPAFDAAAIEALRARDPDAAAREHDAAWIDADTTFLAGGQVEACVRRSPLDRPAVEGAIYVATTDGASRGNGWTFTIARAVRVDKESFKIEIALAREWKGSKTAPLSPAVVFGQMAQLALPYRVRRVAADRWSFDALRVIAAGYGLSLHETTTADRDEGYSVLHTFIAANQIELPPEPKLVADLKAIRRVVTPSGYRIHLPTTPDGRHCDYAPSVALAAREVTAKMRTNGVRALETLTSPQTDNFIEAMTRLAGERSPANTATHFMAAGMRWPLPRYK
jgi:hypothetical protein